MPGPTETEPLTTRVQGLLFTSRFTVHTIYSYALPSGGFQVILQTKARPEFDDGLPYPETLGQVVATELEARGKEWEIVHDLMEGIDELVKQGDLPDSYKDHMIQTVTVEVKDVRSN